MKSLRFIISSAFAGAGAALAIADLGIKYRLFSENAFGPAGLALGFAALWFLLTGIRE